VANAPKPLVEEMRQALLTNPWAHARQQVGGLNVLGGDDSPAGVRRQDLLRDRQSHESSTLPQ
jgi:hypothetical protein